MNNNVTTQQRMSNMAKRATITKEEAITNSVNAMVEQVLNETVQVVDEQTADNVDANGRKKHVAVSMEELEQKGLKNKSAVIRFLDAEGYSRSAIAHFLNIRYQHVRNVLVTELKRK